MKKLIIITILVISSNVSYSQDYTLDHAITALVEQECKKSKEISESDQLKLTLYDKCLSVFKALAKSNKDTYISVLDVTRAFEQVKPEVTIEGIVVNRGEGFESATLVEVK